MRKQWNVSWILLVAIAVIWILMIQVVPRFLSFNFDRVKILNLTIHTDYLLHVFLFIAIVLIGNFLQLKVKIRVLLLLMITSAILAEVIQLYIPQRTFNYLDLIANILGVFIGVGIVFICRKLCNIENIQEASKN